MTRCTATTKERVPAVIEYLEAIQSAGQVFRTERLKCANFERKPDRMLWTASGNFALNFRAVSGGKKIAVRVFKRPDNDRADRYARISNFLKQQRPSQFVPFEYLSDELLVNGTRWPVIVMDWIPGIPMNDFFRDAASSGNDAGLSGLRSELQTLAETLERGTFAHGDLNPGNILVTNQSNGKFQLIDFDGMYVPGMQTGVAGAPAEAGTPGTKHPSRTRANFGAACDRFSLLVIDTTAAALAVDPAMWSFNRDPSMLLFSEEDFKQPATSQVLVALRVSKSKEVRRMAELLVEFAAAPMGEVPTLAEFRKRAVSTVHSTSAASPVVAARAVQERLMRPSISGDRFEEVFAAGRAGDEVDVVGRIHSTHLARDRCGEPYLFVNLKDWSDRGVKIAIFGRQDVEVFQLFLASKNLSRLCATNDARFPETWVSMTAVPEHYKPRNSMTLNLRSPSQFQVIDKSRADRQLALTAQGFVVGRTPLAPPALLPRAEAVVAPSPTIDPMEEYARRMSRGAFAAVAIAPAAPVRPKVQSATCTPKTSCSVVSLGNKTVPVVTPPQSIRPKATLSIQSRPAAAASVSRHSSHQHPTVKRSMWPVVLKGLVLFGLIFPPLLGVLILCIRVLTQ